MATFVDFKAVKAAVSILQVLERYGIADSFKQSGDSLSGPCPLHDGQNPTQFRVSIDKNCWRCFGRCDAGGNVLEFVSKKEGVSLREAALMLCEWFDLPLAEKPGGSRKNERQKAPPDAERENKTSAPTVRKSPEPAKAKPTAEPVEEDVPNKPLGFALQNLETAHPYFAERGLSAECVAHFGLGFCAKGSMSGRVVIPIHNADGALVAYAGRWPGTPPDADTPRYKLPPGFRKGRELFNAHRAFAEPDSSPLVIVEGYFDVFALWQQGFRRVVALMGCSLSAHQEAMIASALTPQSRIVLMLDEDAAGRDARGPIASRLSNHCFVRTFRFAQEGQQPDSLTAEQLAVALT